jgi:N-acetyl-anhydromuramyl-L-alanine amidase AmpD
MLLITPEGHVRAPRVKLAIAPNIERGTMDSVRGIIAHQTGSATAAIALAGYAHPANGAHFLIDEDGTVYQTDAQGRAQSVSLQP